MAGHINVDDSLEEDHPLLNTAYLDLENLIIPNHNLVDPSSSSQSTTPNTSGPRHALITSPPTPLELRQNNPQDCSNLIIASVDRATVEISRTIIRLNATFSQQLQEASISATNGIKSAQGSASSTIAVVVQSASVATSSAFSIATVARIAVTSANIALTSANSAFTSANLAFTSVSSASSSDVSRLSASLTVLQASVSSVEASASAAIAALQKQNGQTLPAIQVSQNVALTPLQAAAIVAGAAIVSILLSFAVYFLFLRIKKKNDRDSYLDEKEFASSPKELPSRLSSTFRTGNAMTIQFDPPKSSDAPTPSRPALRKPKNIPATASRSMRRVSSQTANQEADNPDDGPSAFASARWPLTSSYTEQLDNPYKRPTSPVRTSWHVDFNAIERTIANDTAPPAPEPTRWPLTLNVLNIVDNGAAASHSSAAPSETIKKTLPKVIQASASNSTDIREPSTRKATHDILISNPFDDPIKDPVLEKESRKEKIQKEVTLNPFEDPIQELVSEQVVQDLSIKQQHRAASINSMEIPAEEATHNEPFTTPPKDHIPESLQETMKSVVETPLELPIPKQTELPLESSLETLIEQQLDELALEQLSPEKLEIGPTQELSVSLQKDEEPSYKQTPELDTLLATPTQQVEFLDNKRLSLGSLKAFDAEDERAMTPPPLRQHSPVREASPLPDFAPPNKETRDPAIEEQREETPPPRPGSSIFDAATPQTELLLPKAPSPVATESRKPSLPRLTSMEHREMSPLRRNPQSRNIISLLVEHDAFFNSEAPTEEDVVDDRGARGRSMIRTSDIIEARLSGIAKSKEEEEKTKRVEVEKVERDRTYSPLRRNPVDPAMLPTGQRDKTLSPIRRKTSNAFAANTIPTDQRDRTLSPLRRNPTNPLSIKRKSRTLSPPRLVNSLRRPIPTSTSSREASPLRRNPQQPKFSSPLAADPDTITTSDTRPRRNSNAQFSQALSKFQNLEFQNPNAGIIASNEVTSRAIAGIYIPGSLREQAVRNVSRSRTRGIGEPGMGSMSRSASQPGGRGSDARDRTMSPLRQNMTNH